MPPPEEQLPDDMMVESFREYWSERVKRDSELDQLAKHNAGKGPELFMLVFESLRVSLPYIIDRIQAYMSMSSEFFAAANARRNDRRGDSLDIIHCAVKNDDMSNDTNQMSDTLTDSQAVLDHVENGKPLDAETYGRIRERGERITEELRQKHGDLDIAVELIREVRDES